MTIEEAVTQARQTLGGAASEDAIADQAALLYMQVASPEEHARLVRAELEHRAFEVILEHATELTEEQIRALELTAAQAERMAAARRRTT